MQKLRKLFKRRNRNMERDGTFESQQSYGDKSSVVRLFGHDVTDFSSQYGAESRMSYAAQNLAGNYNIYPNYGDFTQACVFRTYGPWWRIAPSAFKPYRKTPNPLPFESEDFIEVLFEERLYPVAVQIYETYNPGAIVKIMGSDYKAGTNVDTGKPSKWITLWSSPAVETPRRVRICSPPVKKIDTPINMVRLELDHRLLGYYTELDCIMLCGVRPSQSPHSTDSPSLAARTLPCLCADNSIDPLEFQTDKMVEGLEALSIHDVCLCPGDDRQLFEMLPGEVILLILAYLDLPSLCRVAQTCRLLQGYAYDHILYLEINLQPVWHTVCSATLDGLSKRCDSLQRLNLSWCGKGGTLQGPAFSRFLQNCTSALTCLQLSCCSFVNQEVLQDIARYCPDLKELDLSCCSDVDNVSALSVMPLRKMERLNLYRTKIDTHTIIALIRSMQELQHLNLGSCSMIASSADVVQQLGLHCPKLKSLDLWRARNMDDTVFQEFIRRCPLLNELDIGWCTEVRSFSGSFTCIAENCKYLKKLYLTANRTVCDADLSSLAKHSQHLQQLDILGTREVSSQTVEQVLTNCKDMVMIDVSFCAGITSADVESWQTKFPNVNIKKSFQNVDL